MIPPFLRPLPRKFTRVRRQGRCFPYPRIGQLVYSTMSLFVCKAILKISPRNPPVAGRARRVPARGSVAGRARENPYPFASLTHRGFRGWSTQLRWSGRLKIPERPSAEGFYCPARARAPAHEVQRDFPGLRCQPPRPRLGCRQAEDELSAPLPLVSPAGSGPAPRWGASRTERRGSGDRRRTVPTGHLLPQRGRRDLAPPLGELSAHSAD